MRDQEVCFFVFVIAPVRFQVHPTPYNHCTALASKLCLKINSDSSRLLCFCDRLATCSDCYIQLANSGHCDYFLWPTESFNNPSIKKEEFSQYFYFNVEKDKSVKSSETNSTQDDKNVSPTLTSLQRNPVERYLACHCQMYIFYSQYISIYVDVTSHIFVQCVRIWSNMKELLKKTIFHIRIMSGN